MTRILRYEVTVDDEWHTIRLQGDVVHVAARLPDVVEVWAEHHGNRMFEIDRRFRAYGIGHPDVEGVHVGTAIAADGALVWHLRETR